MLIDRTKIRTDRVDWSIREKRESVKKAWTARNDQWQKQLILDLHALGTRQASMGVERNSTSANFFLAVYSNRKWSKGFFSSSATTGYIDALFILRKTTRIGIQRRIVTKCDFDPSLSLIHVCFSRMNSYPVDGERKRRLCLIRMKLFQKQRTTMRRVEPSIGRSFQASGRSHSCCRWRFLCAALLSTPIGRDGWRRNGRAMIHRCGEMYSPCYRLALAFRNWMSSETAEHCEAVGLGWSVDRRMRSSFQQATRFGHVLQKYKQQAVEFRPGHVSEQAR